jgi:hypothetical protein
MHSELYSQDQQVLWYDTDPAIGAEQARSIEIDSQGNVIMVGTFSSENINFGNFNLLNNGGSDIFVVKYNSESEVLWAISAGGSGDEVANGLSIDLENALYITGNYTSSSLTFGDLTLTNTSIPYSDIFIVKLSLEGLPQWAVSAGGTEDDEASAIAADPSGEVAITGQFNSEELNFQNITLSNASTGWDAFIARFNANGTIQWADAIGGVADEFSSSIAIAPNGTTTIAGHYFSTALNIDSFLLSNSNPGWSSDMFLVSYDTNSSVYWAKGFGGTGNEISGDVAINSSGNIILVGGFESEFIAFDGEILGSMSPASTDICVVYMNSAAEVQWAKSNGSINADLATGVSTNNNGDVLVTGYFMAPEITLVDQTFQSEGAQDMYVVHYNMFGTPLWAQNFGGQADDILFAIDCDNSGNLVVCGSFQSGEITVDGETIINGGNEDFIAIKMQYTSIGVESITSTKFSPVFPNPSSGFITIKSENIQEIRIISTTGQEVMHSSLPAEMLQFPLDLSNLPSGSYIILWKENDIWKKELLLLN